MMLKITNPVTSFDSISANDGHCIRQCHGLIIWQFYALKDVPFNWWCQLHKFFTNTSTKSRDMSTRLPIKRIIVLTFIKRWEKTQKVIITIIINIIWILIHWLGIPWRYWHGYHTKRLQKRRYCRPMINLSQIIYKLYLWNSENHIIVRLHLHSLRNLVRQWNYSLRFLSYWIDFTRLSCLPSDATLPSPNM